MLHLSLECDLVLFGQRFVLLLLWVECKQSRVVAWVAGRSLNQRVIVMWICCLFIVNYFFFGVMLTSCCLLSLKCPDGHNADHK